MLSVCSFLLSLSAALAHDGHHGPDHNQISGVRADVHGGLDRFGAVGVGLRVDIPIVPDGFLGGRVRDELAFSPGVELFFEDVYPGWYDPGPYLVPLAMAQWNFYLGERWSIFPEAGVAFYIGDRERWPGWHPLLAEPAAGFGARFHFSERNALLMRVNTPAGLQVGLTF